MERNRIERIDNRNQPASPEELQKRRKECGYSYAELAVLSGVPQGTVQKVLGGFTKAPRHTTMAALDKALFPEKYTTDNHRQGYMMKEHSLSEEEALHDSAAVYGTSPAQEQLTSRVRRRACLLIDQLPGDSVEALIQIMLRMLPQNREETAGMPTALTPQMQAFMEMQEMRRTTAAYDLSNQQREAAIDGKFGQLFTGPARESKDESADRH